MKDIENQETTKKPASPILIGATIGGIVGLLFTLLIQLLAYACANSAQQGENGFGAILMFPWFAIVAPIAIIGGVNFFL